MVLTRLIVTEQHARTRRVGHIRIRVRDSVAGDHRSKRCSTDSRFGVGDEEEAVLGVVRVKGHGGQSAALLSVDERGDVEEGRRQHSLPGSYQPDHAVAPNQEEPFVSRVGHVQGSNDPRDELEPDWGHREGRRREKERCDLYDAESRERGAWSADPRAHRRPPAATSTGW